jgi:hypothetical protein
MQLCSGSLAQDWLSWATQMMVSVAEAVLEGSTLVALVNWSFSASLVARSSCVVMFLSKFLGELVRLMRRDQARVMNSMRIGMYGGGVCCRQ